MHLEASVRQFVCLWLCLLSAAKGNYPPPPGLEQRKTITSLKKSVPSDTNCCGQLWVRHMICGQTCDGLYYFAFCLINLGIPFGSRPIKTALARHSGAFHILPTGLHGLCFGFCFAGPLPLRSLSHGPLSRIHFGESLVIRLHSEIDHIHLSSEAQCVSHLYPQVDCHTQQVFII